MLEDITDPSDFPSSQPYLRDLDESLRCPIRKELLTAPILLTGCGHSFCSLVSSSLSGKPAREPNRILDSVRENL